MQMALPVMKNVMMMSTWTIPHLSPPAEPDANLDGHQASLEFPPDKMDLYERRFENGYDVFTDSDYVAWLQTYHPESAPLTNILSSVTPLQSVKVSKRMDKSKYRNPLMVY